jgi:ketosteroid isomerase-like protein
MASKYEQLMVAYYQTYNSEDAQALAAFYHDDVELVSSQGTMVGLDELLNTYKGLVAIFHDKMTPLSIVIDGTTAVVDIKDSFTAKTNVDDFMGVALKEGESFELRLRGTYQLVDNKFKKIVIEQSQ